MRWFLRTAGHYSSRPGFWVTVFVAAFLLVLTLWTVAKGAPYVNPFWANTSPSPESPLPEVSSLAMVQEAVACGSSCGEISVDVRTCELFWDYAIFRTPGVVEDNVYSIRWRSMISGSSQLGNGILPSWEITAQYIVLIPGNPTAPSGHCVDIRRPSGRVDRFMWNGSAYTAPAGVFDTLGKNASGQYILTDKYNESWTFDNLGMPALKTDKNSNVDGFTYNASYQITAHTDDRGLSHSFQRNANGYLTSISDPAGRTWTFTYDLADNLATITTPSTPDQTNGITISLMYDSQNRLVNLIDGRGNTVWAFAYVGASNAIATITINGNTITYTNPGAVTTRVDRNGNTYRYYYTGNQITKTDMLVNQQAKYVTLYRYSGIFLSNIVLPRGNRIDFVQDSMGNLTQRRHRTQDTSTNDPSDLVHNWVYNTGNFPTSYQDPRGNTWTFGRDTFGNLTSVTHPTVSNPATQNASRSYVYNSMGQVTSVTDEEGTATAYHYYQSGYRIDLLSKIEVDPTGLDLETLFDYDSVWNLSSTTDPRGNSWSYTWDNLRRMTQSQAPSPLSYKVKFNYL